MLIYVQMESNNVNNDTSLQNGETSQGRREMRSLGWKFMNKETFGVVGKGPCVCVRNCHFDRIFALKINF